MARRVNTKFLTFLTVAVVGLLVAGLIAKKFLIRESPEKYVSAGMQMMTEKKYEDAAKNFARAVSLDPKNPNLWVQYGDALNQLSPGDIEYMRRARDAWDRALAIEPSNKPALDRMMQFWSDVANMDSSRPEVFKGLHDTAERLFAADSTNADAEIAMNSSVIRPWLAGVEQDDLVIKAAIDRLVDLMKKYPTNADLPMFISQAKLRQADRFRQQDQTDKTQKLTDEANAIMTDAVKRNPTAAMYFSAAQVAQAQESIALSSPRPDPKPVAEWREKKRALYAKARELSKQDDPLFVLIYVNSARASADRPEAEKILRDLYAIKPDDQQVRLALAEQLATDESKHAEALAILDKPFAPAGLIGPKAYLVRELQIRTIVSATNLRLDELPKADEKDRKAMLDQIQKGLDLVASRDGEGARVLRLRGKLLRMQGKTVEAIQTLERARSLTEKSTSLEVQGDRIDRWEVIDMLARAYIDTQQTGRAKELLTELVNRFPGYDPARMLLAQLLVKEGNLDDARPHIQYLAKKSPENPDVLKLQIQLSDPKGAHAGNRDRETDKKAMKEAFKQLPETTTPQILDKVNAAMVIDLQDEAVRLLNKAAAATPGDYEVARSAVRVYRASGDIDAAKAFVDASLKANPSNTKLQVLKTQVADLTPENLAKVAIEEADKNPDKEIGALIKANAYRRLNEPTKVLEQLQLAKKLKPEDRDVDSLMFSYYIWQKQWDQCDALLEPLARANQDQAGGLLFRYRLAMSRGDLPKALDYGRALVQRMGEFGQSWLALAQVQQAMSQYEDALKNYLAALERQSDNADAFKGAIDCYYNLGKSGEAQRKIVDARRALPANPLFQEMEIRHELEYGDPEKAVKPREEQLKKDPENLDGIMAMGQTYLTVARAKATKSDSAAAAEYFRKAKTTFKQGITKAPDALPFYAYYAETCARSGDLGDAEVLLKQLAARDAWKGKSAPQTLLAEFYGISRRPVEAEAALRAVIAQSPTDVETEIKLANLLVNQKRVDDALAALQANAQDPQVARRRIDILVTANRAEEADKALNDLLAKTPSNLEILQMAINVNIARQNFDTAEVRLKRALELDPKDPTTHYYVGLQRMAQPKADIEAAIAELKLGRESKQFGTEARFALAECLRRKSDPDGAIRELEDALKQQPTNRRVRLALLDAYASMQPARWTDHERVLREAEQLPGNQPDADLLQRAAVMWAARNDPKAAVDAISKALAVAPDNANLQRMSLTMLNKARRYTDVVQRVDALVAKDPNLWWALEARAIAKRYQDHKEEAIQDFEAALTAANTLKDDDAAQEIARAMGDTVGPDEVIRRIEPRAEKDLRFKLMIARLQQTKGDNASAIKTLEQVLPLTDQLPPFQREGAFRFGGTLYLIANQPAKSQQCYESLLLMAPDDMTALNNLAYLLGETVQRPQEGLKYSQHAYDLMQRGNRRDPLVLDTHGWLLVLSGQLDQGIEVLRSANEIKQLPDVHYHLGEAYISKKFAEEALRELDMAQELTKRAVQNKEAVDPAFQGKVEGAIRRAQLLSTEKKSTANAPTGTNVP